MIFTLVFLALLMAAFVAWVVRQSINVQPWVAESSAAEHLPYMPESATARRVGLGVFLAVVTALFALCISAYFMRMEMTSDWRPMPDPALLWLNTGLLVLGSAFLQWAWHGAKHDKASALRLGLAVGGATTMAFVGGQYAVWLQLMDAGFYASSNPANAFFYVLTALHALHLLGGLVPWTVILRKVWSGASPRNVRPSVELCAIYWHFLLLVWAILFSLLLAT